jgi:hypothetical protein
MQVNSIHKHTDTHAQIDWISESWSYSNSMTEIHCKSLFAMWCHYNLHIICIPLISSNRVLDEYVFIRCALYDLYNWKWKTEFSVITKLVTEHICIWWYLLLHCAFLPPKVTCVRSGHSCQKFIPQSAQDKHVFISKNLNLHQQIS